MTTVPTIQGTVSWFSTNGTPPPVVTFPARIDGDYHVVVFGSQTTATGETAPTNNAGMTLIGAPFVAVTTTARFHGVYGLPVPTASTAPTTVTFTRTGTGLAGTRQILGALTIRGVSLSSPVAVASTALAEMVAPTVTVPALTAPEDNCLALVTISSSHGAGSLDTYTSITAGWTVVGGYIEPVGGATSVSRNRVWIFAREVDTGSSGSFAITYGNNPAQATGQMVLLRPKAVTPTRAYPAPFTVTAGVKSYGKFGEYS